MIGQHTNLSVTRRKPTSTPMGHPRTALVVVAILVATGAGGTATSLAGVGSQPRTTADRDEYVLPSKQVMREMRAVIIALYGPHPAARQPHRDAGGTR